MLRRTCSALRLRARPPVSPVRVTPQIRFVSTMHSAESSSDTQASASRGSESRNASSSSSNSEKSSDESTFHTETKDVGNPISWSNPYSGPTDDQKRPRHYSWVYPAGVACIAFWAVWSRMTVPAALPSVSRGERLSRAMERLDYQTSFRKNNPLGDY